MANRFSDLGKDINLVIDYMMKDEKLLKLLANDTYDPLSSTPISKPSKLLFDRIYPIPKIPITEEKEKSLITVAFSNAKSNKRNLKFKDYKLIFTIMCHIDLWQIKDSLRPYEIASRLDNIFNEKRATEISIGKIIFSEWSYREWNEKFCGYYLVYDICDFN